MFDVCRAEIIFYEAPEPGTPAACVVLIHGISRNSLWEVHSLEVANSTQTGSPSAISHVGGDEIFFFRDFQHMALHSCCALDGRNSA